jgi:hypothetical protein
MAICTEEREKSRVPEELLVEGVVEQLHRFSEPDEEDG